MYVSGALTGVGDPERGKHFYERLGAAAAEAGFEAYLPHTETDPIDHPATGPLEVYAKDIGAIRTSDVLLAWLGTPSLGVGAEIAFAINSGIEVLGVRPACATVSRFVVGMLEATGSTVVDLDDESNLVPVTEALLATRAVE